MEEKEDLLINRLKWVSFYRVVIAFISLLLLIYWRSKLDILPETANFIGTLVFIFTVSIFYGIAIRRQKKTYKLIILQIAVDFFVISFIVISTGGVESPFIFFFAFLILEGGIFFSKSGAYIVSFLNILIVGLISIYQYNPVYPVSIIFSSRTIYTVHELLYSFSIFSLEFLVLGLLIGYLSSESFKMRENLRESEARLYDLEYLKNAILTSISDGLIVFDNNNKITFMNETAKNLAKKFAFNGNESFLYNIFSKELKELEGQQKPVRFEKRVDLSSDTIWLSGTMSPLIDHDKNIIGNLLSFQDLTEYKTMEENLRINDKFAFIGKLSTIIAHEIRNPLASLKGSVDFLKDNIKLDEENSKVFDIVTREIDRLNKFITDFLYYSRNTELGYSTIYLKNLLDEIWYEIIFSLGAEEKINFKYEGDENITIKGDPNQMRQVFLNLLLNAVQAIKEKKNFGEIVVSVKKDDDSIVITVEDDGGGIDDKVIDKIFDPFFTTKNGGTGLGLAIVYKIVKDHGGKINVKNGLKGAIFTLRFLQ